MKTIRKCSKRFFTSCTLKSGAIVHPECVFRGLQGRRESHTRNRRWLAKRFLPFGANPTDGHLSSLRAFHNCMNKKLHRPASPASLRSSPTLAALHRNLWIPQTATRSDAQTIKNPSASQKCFLPFGANPINGHLSALLAFDTCMNRSIPPGRISLLLSHLSHL